MRLAAVLVCLAFAAAACARESGQADVARRHLVVAAHPLAAQAGLEILRAGGSALDAAIAAQMVLGLVEPQSSGIGGGAFLLHYSRAAKRVRAYDGRETAPAAARPERFLDAGGGPLEFMDAVVGGRSVGVPGLLRMLELAHRNHGRVPWPKLFARAISLAENGFALSPRLHRFLEREGALKDDPAARRLYYRDDGRARPVGERIANAEYAATLRAIAAFGADAFYGGAIAADIARAVRTHPKPGDLDPADLERYAALEREPVCGPYRGRRVCGMGPPSAGGIAVLQMLAILDRAGFAEAAPNSARAVHFFSESARLAYADRARYVADPAFVPQPVAGLLAPQYLEARARLVGERAMGRAEAGRPAGALELSAAPQAAVSGTSHVSVVDARGDAVSLTTSIENPFGSRIMVRGFLLNNQLTDFAFAPVQEGRAVANAVAAGKRPRSSMAPTLVFNAQDELALVLGSPGGAAIPLYVAKALVAMLDWRLDVRAALSLPNFGSTNGPTLIERGSAYESLAPGLRELGHEVGLADLVSGLQAIERVPGGWRGASDPRREGVARGE